ncbi:hypothetical protein SAMN04487779_1002101 [Belnapia rosea]|uniref:Uncharacterized protein n=1 Tax=Belnapia rosea TaxID=938405 RepID=A0A1G6NQZ0_9PROT|nr:hypothetical protein SAMN04487779_1002101 [Belnapia rosea]
MPIRAQTLRRLPPAGGAVPAPAAGQAAARGAGRMTPDGLHAAACPISSNPEAFA